MASKLNLSLIVAKNPRSEPIINGEFEPDGIDLTVTVAHPSEIFWRQLHFAEFDVSEMSMASLFIARSHGNNDWVGLPIFTTRVFFQNMILVRKDAGIERPEDLKGKRIGVPEYQQTAAVWSRGILMNEFGFKPEENEWWMERTEQVSHGGATGFQPPPGVKLNRIPPETNIGTMMLAKELDATLLYITDPNLVDRARIDLYNHPDMRRLFPDPLAEGHRFYNKTGIFPINHGMVVRRSLLEQHPWIALNLFRTFLAAKNSAAAKAKELAEPYFITGALPHEARAGLATDPFPYGVQGNRKVLETIASYLHQQGLTPSQVPLDDVFAPSTMGL